MVDNLRDFVISKSSFPYTRKLEISRDLIEEIIISDIVDEALKEL